MGYCEGTGKNEGARGGKRRVNANVNDEGARGEKRRVNANVNPKQSRPGWQAECFGHAREGAGNKDLPMERR